jgi:hypothetical protein
MSSAILWKKKEKEKRNKKVKPNKPCVLRLLEFTSHTQENINKEEEKKKKQKSRF